MGWVSCLSFKPNPCPAKGWGLLGCVKQGNAFSLIPRVLRQEPERLDRMPGVCDLPLRLATAGSLPQRHSSLTPPAHVLCWEVFTGILWCHPESQPHPAAGLCTVTA